MVAKEAG